MKAASGDPSKAEMIDRLGIGLSGFGRGTVSHSVASGIISIAQDGLSRGSSNVSSLPTARSRDDEWELIDDFSK